MVRNVGKFCVGALLCMGMVGCAGEFSEDDALFELQSLGEFCEPFAAPLHIGDEILTEANHSDPMAYVEKKYGVLEREGLITSEVGKANSWRTVLRISLSEEGMKYYERERTEKYRQYTGEQDVYFVDVCTLSPESITSVRPLSEDMVEVTYTIIQRDITPFGHFLEYKEGVQHLHTRTFEKGTFGWNLLPIEE